MVVSKRLSILDTKDFEEIFVLPKFNHDDRTHFFSLNDRTRKYVNSLHKPSTKAYFLLLLGYFRAKQQFFEIDQSRCLQDLQYIRRHILNNVVVGNIEVSRFSRYQYKVKILELTGFSSFDEKKKRALKKYTKESRSPKSKTKVDLLRSNRVSDGAQN